MLYSIAYNTYLLITLVNLSLRSALQNKRVSTHNSLGVANGNIQLFDWLVGSTAYHVQQMVLVSGKLMWK